MEEEPAEAVEYWLTYDQMKRTALARIENQTEGQPNTGSVVAPIGPDDI